MTLNSRILMGVDIYIRETEEMVLNYRMLRDVQSDEYTIIQCDSIYSRNSSREFQNTLFHELLVENWNDRSFYPSIEAAIEDFGDESGSNLSR